MSSKPERVAGRQKGSLSSSKVAELSWTAVLDGAVVPPWKRLHRTVAKDFVRSLSSFCSRQNVMDKLGVLDSWLLSSADEQDFEKGEERVHFGVWPRKG